MKIMNLKSKPVHIVRQWNEVFGSETILTSPGCIVMAFIDSLMFN